MNSTQDIRWQQRFANYKRALGQLDEFMQNDTLNKLEKQGLIQAFEYTHELAWKTLADFLKHKGNSEIFGSRDATREAFNLGLISQGDLWFDMISSRNMTSHTYNQEVAEAIIKNIQKHYFDAFVKLKNRLDELL
jgi:nucleotidyltransferase substrate binding protein (TIGR01987 family)